MILNSRRQFLQTSLAVGAGMTTFHRSTPAIEPIQRNGKSLIKLSLAGYSFNRLFRAKPKPEFTMDDFVEFAARLGLEAVEPTAYYYRGQDHPHLCRQRGQGRQRREGPASLHRGDPGSLRLRWKVRHLPGPRKPRRHHRQAGTDAGHRPGRQA
jgi:hypothetical protein